MYTIKQIEDRIVEVLRDGLSAARTVAAYHGEISNITEDFKKFLKPLPAVYVLYSGSKFNETANRSYDEEVTYTIVVIAGNLRAPEKHMEIAYQILEEIKGILIGKNLGLDIEPLQPLAIEALIVTDIFSIYAFDLETSFSYN